MTALEHSSHVATRDAGSRSTPNRLGRLVWKCMTTTDHKLIGNMYFVTSMAFFVSR